MDYSIEIDRNLKKYFGYNSFVLRQKDVITSILKGKDTIAIFPTGGGKSICYQLPALMLSGTTIVISPLISLMKDQVDELDQLNIPAAYISSILSERQVMKTIQDMRRGLYKIVYIAPERFYSEEFVKALEGINIPFVAIDEAHCISQWGHNFRPAYLKIKDLINHMGDPIIGAFTATANRKVQRDIQKLLGMGNETNLFVESFDRPNLEFRIEDCHDKSQFTLNYVLENRDKSGIIYAATRANVEALYILLRSKGIDAGMYHAGLDNFIRNNNQEDFLMDKLKVMVATNAFGMGINKSDVRYIIHYNMPKSLENYYQEAGRAGRDDKSSCCILLHSQKDYSLNQFMIGGNYPAVKLVEMVYERIKGKGRESKGISQELLLKSRTVDRHVLQSVLRTLYEYNYAQLRGGMVYPVDQREFVLTQDEINWHQEIEMDKLDSIKEYCQGKECLRLFILDYFNEETSFKECGNCSVCTGHRLHKALEDIEDIFQISNTDKQEETIHEPLMDEELFRLLKALRSKIDGIEETKNECFNDQILKKMAILKPVTKRQLLKLSGVNEDGVKEFGKQFIKEIHRYLKSKKN